MQAHALRPTRTEIDNLPLETVQHYIGFTIGFKEREMEESKRRSKEASAKNKRGM